MSSYSKMGIKSNVKTSVVKAPKVSISSSSSGSSSPNPLMSQTKRDYGKKKPAAADAFGSISFGQTGLTGRD